MINNISHIFNSLSYIHVALKSDIKYLNVCGNLDLINQ